MTPEHMAESRLLLDRTYAFYLAEYLLRLHGRARSAAFGNEGAESDFARAARDLDLALILFDKILVSAGWASALFALLSEYNLDGCIEGFYPELERSQSELQLILEDSVRLDINDTSLEAVLQISLPDYYRDRAAYEALIWDVNRSLLFARHFEAAILPWPNRVPAYLAKFGDQCLFTSGAGSGKTLKEVLEFQVPGFSFGTWDEVLRLRAEPRLDSLRNLVRDLTSGSSAPLNVPQALEDLKQLLIDELYQPEERWCRALASGWMPFPLNVAVEGVYALEDLNSISDFRWYFLLSDLRRERAEADAED